jgi:hypothetical protein
LPLLRQHAGRLASASGAKSGAISIQLNNIINESAIVRRIAKGHSICELLFHESIER